MPNDDNKIILEFPATNVEIELGETITFDNISGFLDSERVTYNGDSLTEIITHLENDKADTTYVNTELDKKADKTDTYTKTQVDDKLSEKANADDVYQKTETYSKTETDNLVSPKADKTYVDTQLQAKANASDVYTKSQTDNLLNDKADVSDLPDMSQYYDKSEVDTALGTKADQSDFETLENAVSGLSDDVEALDQNKADKSDTYTKAQVDDIVYGILPDDTASGSVANFTTSLELPIKSLEVDVNAVQNVGTPTPASPLPISGWSEISLVKCGKNFANVPNITGSFWGDNNASLLNFINSLPVGSFVFSYNFIVTNFIGTTGNRYGVYFENPNGSIDARVLKDSVTQNVQYSNSKSFTITESTKGKFTHAYLYCGRAGTKDTVAFSEFMCEVGSTKSDYEPYIAPITEVINLGGTYYGGKFTQDKDGNRKLTVDMEKDTMSSSYLSGLSSSYIGYATSVPAMNNHPCIWVRNWKYPPNAKGFVSGGIKAICNAFNISMNNSSIISTQYRIYFDVDGMNITSVADFISAIETMEQNGNNLEICYEVENPVVVDLPDGQPIVTLNGTNNIFADTGDTSVVFKCSVNDYINAHQSSGVRSLGGVFLGGSNIGSEEEPTEESEETKKTKEIDEPKEEIKTIGDVKKLGGE